MAVLGVGIDIVDFSRSMRIMRSKSGKDFIAKTFTLGEIGRIGRCPKRMSAVFAVKEAFYKALGTGFMDGKDVEVVHTPDGMPEVKVHGKLKGKLGRSRVLCSISYSDKLAAGVVVISD